MSIGPREPCFHCEGIVDEANARTVDARALLDAAEAVIAAERATVGRLREALERIAAKGCALRGVLGPTVKSCLEQDERKSEFRCLQCTARAALAASPSPAVPALDPWTVEQCAAQVELAGVCEQCSHVGCVAARQAKRRIRALVTP